MKGKSKIPYVLLVIVCILCNLIYIVLVIEGIITDSSTIAIILMTAFNLVLAYYVLKTKVFIITYKYVRGKF